VNIAIPVLGLGTRQIATDNVLRGPGVAEGIEVAGSEVIQTCYLIVKVLVILTW